MCILSAAAGDYAVDSAPSRLPRVCAFSRPVRGRPPLPTLVPFSRLALIVARAFVRRRIERLSASKAIPRESPGKGEEIKMFAAPESGLGRRAFAQN